MMSEINSQMFLKNMYIKREKSNSAKCQQVLNFGEIHYIIFVTFLQVWLKNGIGKVHLLNKF